MASGEFENREVQSGEYSVPPRGNDIPSTSIPGGNAGIGIPSYPLGVTSTFDTLPLNAFDDNDSGYADGSFIVGNADYIVDGITNIATGVYTYTVPEGYLFVLRKYRVNAINSYKGLTVFSTVATEFIPVVNISINGAFVKQHDFRSFINGGDYSCHYIVPQNTVLKITASAFLTEFDFHAFNVNIYGNLLLSRQYPSNLEIGSDR